MKQLIKKIPLLGPLAQRVYQKLTVPADTFAGSENYWIERYDTGGNSGDGSYRELAEFKAEILNNFIQQQNIQTVIEYGCGDGNQLTLANYPSYLGFDVSPKAIELCENLFPQDTSKKFKLVSAYADEKAELTLSLDVLYHLIEDQIFDAYMHRLFDSSENFVIIYSSDTDQNIDESIAHVKQRKFSEWIIKNKPAWQLLQHIPNKYPFNGDTKTGSISDFYIYKKS